MTSGSIDSVIEVRQLGHLTSMTAPGPGHLGRAPSHPASRHPRGNRPISPRVPPTPTPTSVAGAT
jgi:hypothetical protein